MRYPAGLAAVVHVARCGPDLPHRKPYLSPDGTVALYARARTVVRPGRATVVDTGWSVVVPPGCEGRLTLQPSADDHLRLVNTPVGTLDADYVGHSVGAIVAPKAATDVGVDTHLPLLQCAVFRVVPPPGAPGSPVIVRAGQTQLGTTWSAGADIFADCAVDIPAGGSVLVPVVLQLAFNEATLSVVVRSRSGLAAKDGVSIQPQEISPHASGMWLRAENVSDMARHYPAGTRIAQVVASPREPAVVVSRLQLHRTPASLPRPDVCDAHHARHGGFGHTGR